MTTPAKRDANRENARKSTGPKTDSGKARSSRNAVTHGLTAQPGEPTGAFREALAEWVADLRPRGIVERTLAERACRAAWNLRRCDRYEDATSFKRNRDAGESHDLAEAARVDAVGRRLIAEAVGDDSEGDEDEARGASRPGDEDPALLVAELRRSSSGVGWLLARWGELARALKGPGGWSTSQRGVAVRLLGLRPEAAAQHPVIGRIVPRSADLEGPLGGGSWFGHPALEGALEAAIAAEERGLGDPQTVWLDCVQAVAAWGGGKAASGSGALERKKLAALVRSEREKLARLLKRVLKARGDEDRAGAADRAMFEETRSLSLCLRYATAASRDLHRAIRDFAKLQEEADRDDPDPTQPLPDPRDGDEQGICAGGPQVIENVPACSTAKLRNEATEVQDAFAIEHGDDPVVQTSPPARTPGGRAWTSGPRGSLIAALRWEPLYSGSRLTVATPYSPSFKRKRRMKGKVLLLRFRLVSGRGTNGIRRSESLQASSSSEGSRRRPSACASELCQGEGRTDMLERKPL